MIRAVDPDTQPSSAKGHLRMGSTARRWVLSSLTGVSENRRERGREGWRDEREGGREGEG